MKVFNLPDLGEGLPDAEIVEWLVAEGDEVTVDQPLVSMETAKAVVEVPSPFTGKVVKFHGNAGDVIKTGAPLAEFQVEGDAGAEESTQSEPPATEVRAESEDSQAEASGKAATEPAPAEEKEEREDSGTVVGKMQAGGEVLNERTSTVGGVKVTPAVRALARKLKVDLSAVQATGADGVVTASDVRKAAEEGSAPARPRQAEPAPRPETRPEPEARSEPSAKPAPAPQPAAAQASGDWEPVRGTRRTMARVMSESHKSVVPTTLMDDADIHAWRPGEDITVRLLRALWAGASAEPGLNAWFDGKQEMRMIHKNMHVGMAVDTPDGLFVAALRNVNQSDKAGLRSEINRLRENVQSRSIPPEDLKDYTIILSNFGKFAGRYATPVITPPCVAIVAAGALRHEVVPVLGGVEAHRMIPLSLTFDHRACTGGEAARFLKAMLDDLAKAE
jgi:2-oxoisovalerate dehydrogenase E2 component (dihydrolipoyl transacylase)